MQLRGLPPGAGSVFAQQIQLAYALHVRMQRLAGGGMRLGRNVCIGQRQPVIERAAGALAHGSEHFGLAGQPVGLETDDGLLRFMQHVAVGRQDEVRAIGGAGGGQFVE